MPKLTVSGLTNYSNLIEKEYSIGEKVEFLLVQMMGGEVYPSSNEIEHFDASLVDGQFVYSFVMPETDVNVHFESRPIATNDSGIQPVNELYWNDVSTNPVQPIVQNESAALFTEVTKKCGWCGYITKSKGKFCPECGTLFTSEDIIEEAKG